MEQEKKKNLFKYSKKILSGHITKTTLLGIIAAVFLCAFSFNVFAEDIPVDVVITNHVKGQLGTEIDAFMIGKGEPDPYGWYNNIKSLTVSGGTMDEVDFGTALDSYGKYSGLRKAGDRATLISVDLSGTSLESHTLTETLPDTLPESAFWYAQNLTNVVLPESVTTINNTAFGNCQSLTSYTFPDSVTTIGTSVFAYCSRLTSVTIPAGVTTIGDYLFTYYGPDSKSPPVKDVYMSSITPNSITVSTNSFSGAFAILHVPDGSINNYYGDTRDGDATDRKWFGLYINDPDRAPVIKAERVWNESTDAARVYFTSDFPGQYYYALVDNGAAEPDIDTTGAGIELNNSLWVECELTGLTAAKDMYIVVKDCNGKISNKLKMDIPAYDAAPVNIAVTGHVQGKMADEIAAKLIESDRSYNYDKVGGLTVNGGSISSDDADFISDLYCIEAADFSGTSFVDNTVPVGFLDWSGTLKTIILPNSVETIGEGAFYELSVLENITLPSSVKTIGDYAFYELDSLKSLTLGSSNPPTVGVDVFATLPTGGATVYVPSGSKAAYLAVNDGDTTDDKWYGLTVKELCPVTYKGAQKRTNTNPVPTNYDIRLVATINTLAPDSVGFVYSSSNETPIIGGTNTQQMDTTKVYSSILASGAAKSYGEGTYIIACPVEGVSNQDNFYVRAYAIQGTETIYTDVFVVVVARLN